MDVSDLLKKYNIPKFEELKTSTRTVIVYFNLQLDLQKIFESIPITNITVPLTKKKKNVDKKKIIAPYGAVISLQNKNVIRGIDLRKNKKHWCPACQLVNVKEGREIKVNTVVEEIHKMDNSDIQEIKYFCTKCEAYFSLRQLKKITNFLNQVTIVLSIGKIVLNIMMFKNNCKIAGCKDNNDAIEAISILWKNFVYPSKGWTLLNGESEPKFVFSLVMRNVDFNLGFFIDRKELNRLMNDSKYSNIVYMSQHESTGHTNVNIKMYAKKPETFKYDCLVMKEGKEPNLIKIKHNPYKPGKNESAKKRKKPKFTTAIVFSSSEIILSGRYEENMRDSYNFFVNTTFKNKELIEEKLNAPNKNLIEHLKNFDEGTTKDSKKRIEITKVKTR